MKNGQIKATGCIYNACIYLLYYTQGQNGFILESWINWSGYFLGLIWGNGIELREMLLDNFVRFYYDKSVDTLIFVSMYIFLSFY